MVEHRTVTRKVVSSTPAGPTLRVNYICKWLDFQVFSDKDDRLEVPSDNPSMSIILWDVKEPTHLSLRVGHVVPGVVVCLLLSIMVGRVTKAATVIGASCCGALPA